MNYSGWLRSAGSGGHKAQFDFKGVDLNGAPTFLVPDSHLLFSGEYRRAGEDLIISDHQSHFTIPDYFKSVGHSRPFLVSPDGAPLSPNVVDALTGHAVYAQAGPQAVAGKVVGHVAKMTGSASIVRNGVTIVANVGDAIYQNDVVQTGSNSTIGLVLDDGSTFNLSANARFLLNDLSYDPNSTSNSLFLTLVQGAASFVAGQVAKTGDMRVATPVASIGIRGTAVNLDISSTDGKVSISVVDQQDGTVHAVQVFNNAGVLIGTVTSNGTSLTLTPTATFDVIAQQVNKTPDQVAQEFSAFQQVLSTYDAAKQIFPNLPQHTDNSDHQNNNANPNSTTKFAGSPPLNPPGTEYQPPAGTTKVQTGSVQTASTTVVVSTTTSIDPSLTKQLAPTIDPIITPVKVVSLPFVVTPPSVVSITTGSGDHTGPVMSANGDVVYDPDGAIYFYNRATNTTTTIASPANSWSYESPTISSDGRYIFYQGSNGGSSYVFVYGTDPSDSNHYHVRTLLGLGQAPAVSGDGGTIVAAQASGNIAIYDIQGSLKGAISPAAVGSSGALWLPAISADGHVIAFWNSDAQSAGGSGDLYAFNRSTATIVHVASTISGAGTAAPTVSADGHLIAYQSTDPTGHSEIYLYDLQTNSIVFQTTNNSGSSYSPVLSPDGHFIVFTSDAQLTSDDTNSVPDVYVVDVTSPANPIYKLVSESGGVAAAGGVAISAGGQYVAFGSNDNIFFADPTSGHSAVIVETASSSSTLTADGLITLTGDSTGVQISVADQFGNPTPNFGASFDGSGHIHWTFVEDRSDFAALAYGKDATQEFVITLSADTGTLTIPVFVTVHNGVQPTISVADFAPVASPVSLQDGQESVPYTILSGDLLSHVVDVDGPSLSISSLSIQSGDGTISQIDSQTWTFSPTAGFSGHVVLNYQVTDSIKSAGSTASFNIALPLAITSINPDSGVTGDFITKDTMLTVSGTNGTLVGGERIQVSSDNGVSWADVTQNTATTWNFADPTAHNISFTYQVRVLDASNISINSAAQAIVVDTTPPTLTIDGGDGATNQASVGVAGTINLVDSGSLVTVFDDGQSVGSAIAGSDGKWSTTVSLHDGANSLTAQATDIAGNLGTSNAVVVTLDTTAPAEAVAITAIATDSGSSSTDFITNDTTLTVSGTNGALASDEKIQVSSDNGTTWADVTQSTATSWSYIDPTTHTASFSYQVRIVDAAGNVGTTDNQAVTIDTTAPTIAITSPVAGDNVINKTEAAAGVTITGTATAGSAAV
ncbi:cadherin-like domain-containing protein, partial [Bradyrhizobium manausense]|uniref:Ig-like domain-containing protein n=1 Tax=Bradyrhizobium manausense TaxID=989370 RepID=UPI001BA46105